MLKTLFKGTGNYRIKDNRYYYFGNCICEINENEKTFWLDACGYNGYSSTTRALNDLQKYYESRGYELLWRK